MVEMKNRFAEQISSGGISDSDTSSSEKQDAMDALQALGYKPADIARAMKQIDSQGMDSEKIIKSCLQVLSGRIL